MRLIDADALFEDICDSMNEIPKIGIMIDGEWLWAKLNDALENAPTIKPEPEIIHCRDCIFYEYDMGECGHRYGLLVANDDSFCSLAERSKL